MNIVLIANIISIIGAIILVLSGIIKKKSKILYVQTLQIGLAAISNFLLKGYSGAVTCLLSCVRNILCYFNRLNVLFKIIITVLTVVISLYFNKSGWIGYLPVIGNVIYIWLMDKDNIYVFKGITIFAILMWLIYDFYHLNIVSGMFDGFTIITTSISIFQIRSNKNS